MKVSFSLPKGNKNNKKLIFAGDVGATKTNLALFKVDGDHLLLQKEGQFISKNYTNIIELADSFLKELPLPDAICFGVAGPVQNNKAFLSNLGWELNIDEIAEHFHLKNIQLINDLEATAFGLAVLEEKDIKVLSEGSNNSVGNVAVIAPGTGLGEAGLYWDGANHHPFASEGGHCDFAPRNELDFELYNYLQQKFGHVSWERLLSGPGIVNIYHFLRDKKKMTEPKWLSNLFENGATPAVISTHTEESGICKETMELFVRYLAYESANLVLKYKATGGLYIGGGIAPQIISLFENYSFLKSFYQSGRLNFILEKVPVKIILNSKAALLGASYYCITK